LGCRSEAGSIVNPRDLYLDEDDAPSVYPTFVSGMRVHAEDIREEFRDVPVVYEDDNGRRFDCVVAYDGDTAAFVDGWDERGNRAEFSDEQREAIVMIAERKT
jgi:signal peptidase I